MKRRVFLVAIGAAIAAKGPVNKMKAVTLHRNADNNYVISGMPDGLTRVVPEARLEEFLDNLWPDPDLAAHSDGPQMLPIEPIE